MGASWRDRSLGQSCGVIFMKIGKCFTNDTVRLECHRGISAKLPGTRKKILSTSDDFESSMHEAYRTRMMRHVEQTLTCATSVCRGVYT
jgi:hypothetical protein